MDAQESKKHLLSTMRRKVLLIILLILITVEVLLFILIKTDEFNVIDIETTKDLQESLFDKNAKSIPFGLEFVHFLNDIYSPYFLIAIIYNYFTVYDCFILVNILSFDYIFSFLLKIIYNRPCYKYFETDEIDAKDIEIFYCGYGWGFPSEECVIAVSLYLSIWKIANKLSFKNYTKRIIQIISLIFILVLLSVYIFCTLLTGYYFLSQIIFSIVLGFIIYLLFLESNFFNLLNGNEFMNFIKSYKYILYIIINLLLFIIFSIVYISERLNKPKDENYVSCSTIDNTKQFNRSGNYYSYLDGTYCFNVLFLGNIFSIVGIIMDIKYCNDNNINSYYQINFPQEFESIISTKSMGSFSGSINITQETVWNSTPPLITILRLLFILVFCWACFFPYFFVPLINEHITLILFIKMFLPPMIFYMGIFFYLKPLLKMMKLTNSTLHTILDDI